MTDNKKSFVVFRENPSIYVLKFSPLNRESVDAWRDYLLKYNGQFPDPLRTLYDYTECDEMPSPYILSVIRELVPKLITPKNTRNAYLCPNQSFLVWANVFFGTRVERGGAHSFLERDKAIAWLMEGLDNPETEDKKDEESEA